MAEDLDNYDWKLLRALQKDSRLSHVQLSEQVNLSPSQCARRLQRLEALGIIRGYTMVVDQKRVGLGLTALRSGLNQVHQMIVAASMTAA